VTIMNWPGFKLVSLTTPTTVHVVELLGYDCSIVATGFDEAMWSRTTCPPPPTTILPGSAAHDAVAVTSVVLGA
jgi:hypothetical protein